MICPKCQTYLPEEANFCSACGTRLKGRKWHFHWTKEHYVLTLEGRPPIYIPREPIERAAKAAVATAGRYARRRLDERHKPQEGGTDLTRIEE
jgi:predicted amidophosphoribosyltransferase